MTEAEKVEVSEDFELVNQEDEEQILAELRGVPIDKFIYKNARGQWELTYAGTKWAVRKMAEKGETIRIDEHPKVEKCVMDPEYLTVTVIAKRVLIDRDSGRETLLDTIPGAARNWIKQKTKDGRILPDEHFYQKAVSRASRNGMQSLMAQDFKKEIIDALAKMQAGGAAPARPAAKGAQKAAAPAAAAKPPAPATAPAAPAAPAAQKPASTPAAPAAQKPAQAPAAPKPPAAAPASAPATTAKPAPAAPAAPKAAAPAAKPAVPNTTKPAPDQSPKSAAQDVMAQRFAVVLKQAAGTTDHAVALKFLESITGKKSISGLSKDEIKELGPLMNGIFKGTFEWKEGAIRDVVTGEIAWPRQPEQVDPPSDPVPPEPTPDAEPPAPGTEEMF